MSKIIVDRMPNTPLECAFAGGDGWCSMAGHYCRAPYCPYIVAISDIDDKYESVRGVSMTANDYQQACLRTESVAPNLNNNQYSRILQGLMGLNGEAGECIDILKKVLFQGHDLDKERLAGELGDVAWYLAVSADAIGYDLETIFKKNIEKLNKRYPNGFDAEKSVHRIKDDV